MHVIPPDSVTLSDLSVLRPESKESLMPRTARLVGLLELEVDDAHITAWRNSEQ
jgi:hypothetical protein